MHLEVTDLGRSTAFWTDVIGLVLRSESQDEVELGTKAQTLVTLHPGAQTGFLQGHSGLYHLAVHPPTEADFARILLRLIRVGWQISPTDHIMSKAIYLLDPDGITVEITLETPERLRGFHFDDNGPYVLRQDGSRSNGREPLDVRAVLAALPDDDTTLPVPEGTKIGHVHLYVGDLEAAYGFYRTFGFNQAVWAPRFHMGDLGGGGAFNHRIAVNTWQGIGAPQSPRRDRTHARLHPPPRHARAPRPCPWHRRWTHRGIRRRLPRPRPQPEHAAALRQLISRSLTSSTPPHPHPWANTLTVRTRP
ncbi:VOC family protein [Curtobacterium sp. MCJR17_043]|uniref:VOC family protein n=1 Tax=Curtobacterium sp. MCJR17_043 TaxID=2175660 RepID=UPI0024E03812|nr:VOC family protein [Curtobacterium sp. MCJR17_043]WIB36069.1 VOC family protein [Curtobacterium sp. MCJR17_043]